MQYVKTFNRGHFDKSKLKSAEQKLKREIMKKLNTARKRIMRLEKNNLQDSPAYQTLVKNGNKPKFGVRGKTFNELQQELARLNKFLNSETSTVRGTNRILKDLAQVTNIKYKRIGEIQAKAKVFFEIASKVEQYLDTTQGMAGAIGYQRIWDTINTYVAEHKKVLESAETDVEDVAVKLGELLATETVDNEISEIEKDLEKFFK